MCGVLLGDILVDNECAVIGHRGEPLALVVPVDAADGALMLVQRDDALLIRHLPNFHLHTQTIKSVEKWRHKKKKLCSEMRSQERGTFLSKLPVARYFDPLDMATAKTGPV